MPLLNDLDFFERPAPQAKLWRYMDLSKYVSLLSTTALWFSRADLLGDPFEGSVPALNVEGRRLLFLQPGTQPEAVDSIMERMAALARRVIKMSAVSCWHESEVESAAMWSIYVRSGEGIALQTTVDRLVDALAPDTDFRLGRVRYVDYQMEAIPDGNMLWPLLCKRNSFAHEREVRALILGGELVDASGQWGTGIAEPGVSARVDLGHLIEKVHLSPSAPAWLVDAVRQVTAKFGVDSPVCQSAMDGSPLY